MKIPWIWILFLGVMALLVWGAYSTWGLAGVIGIPLGIVALVFAGKLLGGWLLQRAFMIPFAAKGKVLRRATLEVHDVTPCEVPKSLRNRDDDEDEVPARDLSWYWIDATVTPKPGLGPFHLWEAGEIQIVPEKTRPGMPKDDADEWGIHSLRIWNTEQNAWQKDEAYKYPGRQRLRMRVGVPPKLRRARLRYYFEVFGDVRLPECERTESSAD